MKELHYFPEFDHPKYALELQAGVPDKAEKLLALIEEAYIHTDELLWTYRRKGFSRLMEYLVNETDYLMAPASTKFHGNFPGGLLVHSYAVTKRMQDLKSGLGIDDYTCSDGSMVFCGLFHDLCKVDYYKNDYATIEDNNGNALKKIYLAANDSNPIGYCVDEKYICGFHGPKSVYMLQKYFIMKNWEAAAIMCHMGNFESKDSSKVFETDQLAWLLHAADEAATFIDHL